MDLLTLLLILNPILSLKIYQNTYRLINSKKLINKNYPKDIRQIRFTPYFRKEFDSVDFDHLAQMKCGEDIVEFAKKMIENFNDEDLTNFYNNINRLNIKDLPNNLLDLLSFIPKKLSSYDLYSNTIEIDNENNVAPLYHQLTVMASSKHRWPLYCSGFLQKYKL